MTPQEFDAILDELLNYDIEITITLDRTTRKRWHNLNSGMKSDIEIALIGDEAVWRGRYDMQGTFEDTDDLRWIGKNKLMCGRDYASPAWLNFMGRS